MSELSDLIDRGVARWTRARRITVAFGLNLVLVAAEAIGGALGHSTALLADAGHNLADACALLLALVAVRLALRSPTATRSYGYHRATVVAATANVALLLLVTVLVVAVGIDRLLHPVAVDGTVVVAVAALALVLNGTAAAVLRDGSRDLNVRVAFLHLAGDGLASLGVLGAGVAVLASRHAELVDPAVSLGVALLVAFEAVRVGRESINVLLEGAPPDIDLGALAGAIASVSGVSEVHDLHCWSLSSEVRALSAHVVLNGHPSLEEAQVVGERVKQAVAAPFAISHSTLELECERCVDEDVTACAIDEVVVP
ncbi:MAG: cation diffusion facilitator family transporter [Acidimicrobiaceae bacterium]|nr:cation diffusion facilitator family transporter [Acidimicrobiaceae bacterium]